MITLKKANLSDSEKIHNIRFDAFSPLLERYQDYDTNPANRTIEHVIQNMQSDEFDFYLIISNANDIGYLRVGKKRENRCELSQMAILQKYQGNGYAQEAIGKVELFYPNIKNWGLETIKQEEKLRHLYEKMGYEYTGEEENINDKMDLVFYEKHIN